MNDLAPARARHRHGLPVLRALPVADGRGEHRLPALSRAPVGGRPRAAGAQGGRDAGSRPACSTGCPGQISEGEKQRVAVARAIVRDPNCFLFDEPLSRLDVELRQTMRGQIKEVLTGLSKATVIVTHDQLEALTMADRIAIMRDGIIEQIASPHAIFAKPGQRLRRRLHRHAADEPDRGVASPRSRTARRCSPSPTSALRLAVDRRRRARWPKGIEGDVRRAAARLQPRRRRLGADDFRRGRADRADGRRDADPSCAPGRSTCASWSRARSACKPGHVAPSRLRPEPGQHLRRRRKGGALMSETGVPRLPACRRAPRRRSRTRSSASASSRWC